MKKVIKIKPMKGVIAWYIKVKELLGFFSGAKGSIIGWTSAWDTIYIKEAHMRSKKLIAHELKHIEQMDRHGKIKFMFLYVIELFRNGYKNNKYEVEARGANYNDMIKKYKLQRT